MGKRGKQEAADGEELADSGCATSRSSDNCGQNHYKQTGWWSLLSKSHSYTWSIFLKRINHQWPLLPPYLISSKDSLSLGRRSSVSSGEEREEAPTTILKKISKSYEHLDRWGRAMLELVTKLVSVGFLVYWSILIYFLKSGRGRYLGLLTLLALVFFQIRRD